jgi:hypothetical protein
MPAAPGAAKLPGLLRLQYGEEVALVDHALAGGVSYSQDIGVLVLTNQRLAWSSGPKHKPVNVVLDLAHVNTVRLESFGWFGKTAILSLQNGENRAFVLGTKFYLLLVSTFSVLPWSHFMPRSNNSKALVEALRALGM